MSNLDDLKKEDIRIGTLINGLGVNPSENIRQILAHGFESFSITFGRHLQGVNLKKLAPRVLDVLGDSGAVISSLNIYGNPLESGSEARKTVASFKEAIEAAPLFGTNLITGFAGRLRGKRIDESIPKFKKVFGELAQRAADSGVRIAFENCAMGGTWDNGDWNIAHHPVAWKMMFDALPLPNLGLEWEPCHQIINLIDPMAQIRVWAGKIFHVHGKDATLYWDIIRKYGIHGPHRYACYRLPGLGDSNWIEIIKELREGGFQGSIDIEGWHDPLCQGEVEMSGQVQALQYLKQCREEKENLKPPSYVDPWESRVTPRFETVLF